MVKKKIGSSGDQFKTLKHSTSAPYAYTVFGVSMIPSVLTSQKAIETSIRIIDAFVAMRRLLCKMQASPETILELLK